MFDFFLLFSFRFTSAWSTHEKSIRYETWWKAVQIRNRLAECTRLRLSTLCCDVHVHVGTQKSTFDIHHKWGDAFGIIYRKDKNCIIFTNSNCDFWMVRILWDISWSTSTMVSSVVQSKSTFAIISIVLANSFIPK